MEGKIEPAEKGNITVILIQKLFLLQAAHKHIKARMKSFHIS